MLFDILDYRYTNTDLHGHTRKDNVRKSRRDTERLCTEVTERHGKIMYGNHGETRKDYVRKPRRDTEKQNGVAIPC